MPFLNVTTFVKHKYTKHSAGNCGKCNFKAKNRSQLKKHISTNHIDMSTPVSPQEPMICSRCNIKCASELSMYLILNDIFGGKGPIKYSLAQPMLALSSDQVTS